MTKVHWLKVEVNGKVKDKINSPASDDKIEEMALTNENILKFTESKQIAKYCCEIIEHKNTTHTSRIFMFFLSFLFCNFYKLFLSSPYLSGISTQIYS